MKRALAMVALLAGVACKDEGEALPTKLSVDPELTLAVSLGGDVGLAVDVDACERIQGPATATADGQVIATLDSPEPLVFASGTRFIINLPAAELERFAAPARLSIVIEAVCDGERVAGTPYELTYLKTSGNIGLPTGVTRFWPSETSGELLACTGTRLQRYDASGAPASSIDLGFSCSLGELRGLPGERRYFTVDRGGMAAIDPGPTLVWSRHTPNGPFTPEQRFVFESSWTRPDRHIVVQYREVDAGPRFTVLVDRDTGLNLSPAMPLTYGALGPVSRDADGNISVLTRDQELLENVYYLEMFTPEGVAVRPPVQTSRYPNGLPNAEFSYDGDRLYVTADDGEQNRWIQAVRVSDGTVTQLTQPSDGFTTVIAEAYFRVLVASADHFAWVDRDGGGLVSSPFAPDDGIQISRLRVEPDGTAVMLAQGGFYMFSPDGSDFVRLHADQQYGWLTESWTGGSLVSVNDAVPDVQVVPTRAEYLPD